MKFFIAVLVLSSSLAHASSNRAVHPNRLTCQELNDLLEAKGRITVVYGLLGLSRGSMWLDSRDADRKCAVVERPEWNSRDGKCVAGYMCELMPDNLN